MKNWKEGLIAILCLFIVFLLFLHPLSFSKAIDVSNDYFLKGKVVVNPNENNDVGVIRVVPPGEEGDHFYKGVLFFGNMNVYVGQIIYFNLKKYNINDHNVVFADKFFELPFDDANEPLKLLDKKDYFELEYSFELHVEGKHNGNQHSKFHILGAKSIPSSTQEETETIILEIYNFRKGASEEREFLKKDYLKILEIIQQNKLNNIVPTDINDFVLYFSEEIIFDSKNKYKKTINRISIEHKHAFE